MRRIRRLSLQNFRSYADLSLSLDGRSVALSGNNGVGKTNLLEALSFLGPGRGLRRAALTDVLRHDPAAPPLAGWGIGANLADEDEDEPRRLALWVANEGGAKKKWRIDGEPVPSAGRLLEELRFSWLTPAQDRLFTDSPGERRRFLDRMVLAFDPAHALAATTYEKAMRQRQAVLAEPRQDARLLSVLERQMAEAGVAIAAARVETAARLAQGYERIRGNGFPAASLALEGELEQAVMGRNYHGAEDHFQEQLVAGRRRDAEVGRALTGPHRSDLLVTHREKGQPAKLCSTGEQKALLIGLVLAHAVASLEGESAPLILLLDEVAAHLDEGRREALADILSGLEIQCFMTGTDSSLFAAWGARAQHLAVASDGQISSLADPP